MEITYKDADDYIIPNLRASEVGCHCCGLINVDYRFLYHWAELREEWGSPLKMTSICRCPDHNKAVNGHKNSLHMTTNARHKSNTHAGDISTRGWTAYQKKEFAKLAIKMGWSIGCAETFIHVDLRTEVIGYAQATFFYGGAPSWYS